MRRRPIASLLGVVLALGVAGAQAQDQFATAMQAADPPSVKPADPGVGPETNLPLPRFVSLRSDKINVRRGPGLDYRIDWVFQRAGLPVRIVDEYGHWRKIADSDDAGGWVYHALLTSRRTALITEPEVTFRAEPADDAPATARAEQGVVAGLLACRKDWCELEAKGATGWVRKTAIWGVEPGEVFGG
jgi:SH3-like domain-containing protein